MFLLEEPASEPESALTFAPFFVESCLSASASMGLLTIHCLAGSTLELHVDDVETGLDVRRRVAGSVGLSASSIVLTSGERIFSLIG